MDYREKIISNFADKECKQICRKTIRTLKKMTEGMQSGEDSPFESIWDEICEQVQFGELSIFLNFYLDLIQAIISPQLRRLDELTKDAIWLQTNEGDEFMLLYEDYKECDDSTDAPELLYYDNDISNYILKNYVLHEAANTTNARIEKYLESKYK